MLYSAEQLRDSLPWRELINALDKQFEQGCVMPVRHHHQIEVPGEQQATLLLMPAWIEGEYIGVKQVTVFPGNGARNMPAISGNYLLSCGKTGQLLAMMDGAELTARRTPAASVLAARYLARAESKRLLIVGTGKLCPNLVEAYASEFPLQRIAIWGRDLHKAQAAAKQLQQAGFPAVAVEELEEEVGSADIISCCTLSEQPLVLGEWLKPGVHLDLIGGFRPTMRETDDEAIRRSRVFVDTVEGATKEAGDIVIPLQTGALVTEDIQADLFQLCRGERSGRQGFEEITLFKSVGAALEDLAAAILVYQNAQPTG
ncbi:MAG: alanine dehydrogenase [Motiliproteus sp.]|jgi:alanine dehydrogenase